MERFNAPNSLYRNQLGGSGKQKNTSQSTKAKKKDSPRSPKKVDTAGMEAFRKQNRLLTVEINKLRKELEQEKNKSARLEKQLTKFDLKF